MHRIAVARLPVVKRVERARAADTTEKHERGIAVGHSAGGQSSDSSVVVRFDVVKGELQRNDEAAIALPPSLASSQDPLTPGLVAVDDKGQRALVMSAKSAHGDPALVLVDLEGRSTAVVRSFEGPGWMVGGFAGAAGQSIVCCEQRLSDKPRFSVVVFDKWVDDRAGKSVWSIEAMGPPCVPVRLTDDVIALVACAAPDPLTCTGPGSLVAIDLKSGAFAVLAPADGQRVRLEKSGGETALVVDGGGEVVRVFLA